MIIKVQIMMNSNVQKFRVGIVGCGRIGSLLEKDPLREKPCTHAAAISYHPELEIVSACDFNKDRIVQFGKDWSITSLYDNYLDMFEDIKPDIVSVAAWSKYHKEIVCSALDYGVKGIYCEKPIAGTLKDAQEMVSRCREMNVKLLVGHERRYHHNYIKTKEIISNGEIGEIKTIIGFTQCGAPPKLPIKEYYGGPIFHDGTHLIDIMRFFSGEIYSVYGKVERSFDKDHLEHTAHAILKFHNGATGFIEGGGEKGYFRFEVDIQGTLGRIVIGNDQIKLYRIENSKRFTDYKELVEYPLPRIDKENPFINAFSDLVKSIKTGKEPISSGIDGERVIEVIYGIYESSNKGFTEIILNSK